jgi:dihydroneopterin triphosphate diphosphatase
MHAAVDFKRPESVLVVVHTTELECLLLERVEPRGFWQSVTGSLRWDETPAECAARELAEETGLAATGLRDAQLQQTFPILPAWRSRYAPDIDSNLEHLWYLELPEVRAIELAPREHAAYLWLPIDGAIEKVASWTNREALARLKAQRA